MATNIDQSRQPEPTDRRRLILSVGWSLLIFVLCLFDTDQDFRASFEQEGGAT